MRRFVHSALSLVALMAVAAPAVAQPPFVSLKSRLARLKHPDAEVRRDAVSELATGADPALVVPALLAALDDPEYSVQDAAATALMSLSNENDVQIRALCVKLKGKDEVQRIQAAERLGQYGDAARQAVWPLLGLLSDHSHSVRWTAAYALGAIGPAARDAVPELLRLVKTDRSRGGCGAAALALGQIGADPERVIPELLAFIERGAAVEDRQLQNQFGLRFRCHDIERTSEAELGVVKFGTRAFPDLRKALEDEKRHPAAYRVLARFGPEASPFLDRLVELIERPDADVMRLSHVFRQIGAPAVPPLIALLKNPRSEVADRAEQTLGNFGQEAVPRLIQTLEHRDRQVRHRACRAVASNLDLDSPHGPAAIGALVRFTKDGDAAIRAITVSTLGRISADVHPDVLRALHDPSADVRRAACNVLGQRQEHACVSAAPLAACLGDADPFVRLDAVAALWQLERRADPVLPAVAAALCHEKSDVRSAGIALLHQVHRDGNTQPATALMADLQRMRWFDPDEDVRSGIDRIVNEIEKELRR